MPPGGTCLRPSMDHCGASALTALTFGNSMRGIRGRPSKKRCQAVDAAIAAGKVRYAGVSNYSGWQVAQAATLQSTSAAGNPLVSVQVEYSLVQRGVEREVIPASEALASSASVVAAGTRTLTGRVPQRNAGRVAGGKPTFSSFVQPYLGEDSRRVVDAVCTAAQGLTLNPSKLPSPGSATNPVSAHQSLARGLPHNSRWDSLQTT